MSDFGLDPEHPCTEAVNTLISISLTNSQQNVDKSLLSDAGKRFFSAICLLSENNPVATLEALFTLLQCKARGRSFVDLNLKAGYLQLAVVDLYTFQVIVISALNYIPSNIRSEDKWDNLLVAVFYRMFEFINVRSPYSICITKTAYIFMRKYLMGMDMPAAEKIILSAANTFMILSPYAKALHYVEKMLDLIVKKWTSKRRTLELLNITNSPCWNNLNCYLVTCLLNNWPSERVLVEFLHDTADRICSMLTDKNRMHGALKILDTATSCIALEDWLAIFGDRFVQFLVVGTDELGIIMKTTLAECACFAVKQYGGAEVYLKACELELCHYYRVLLLYFGVLRGSADLYWNALLNKHIQRYIVCGVDHLEYHALRTLCLFINKRADLEQWHIECVYQYFERHQFDFGIDWFADYEAFFSHYCVQANFAVRSENLSKTEVYANYLQKFYKQCLVMMTSENPRQTTIGIEMFCLIRCVFEGSSSTLKLKYNLQGADEQYKENQSPFYKLLVWCQIWDFTNIKTWDKMFHEFMKDAKMHSGIASFIMKWCSESLPQNKNDNFRIFCKGRSLLLSNYDYEACEKGVVCVIIGLSDLSLTIQIHRLMMKDITKNFLRNRVPMTNYPDLLLSLTDSPIIGLTKCVLSLLRFRDPMATADQLTDIAFRFADATVHKILIAIEGDQTHEFYNSDNPDSKVVEYMLICCFDLVREVFRIAKGTKDADYLEDALLMANRTIEHSNMKRAVTTAAVLVRKLCLEVLTSQPSQQVIIIKFLEFVLFSIYAASDHLTSKIRRNPEHRLLIHAIVVADLRPNNPFLARAMEFLLGVLSDCSSTSGSITSALNSVEIILSDNSLRISTLPYISSVMVPCINMFSSKDWQIKNADIQLFKALCNRLLGQKCSELYRNSIEDIFLKYPELAVNFYSHLRNAHVDGVPESTMAILAVFSESHRKCGTYLCKEVEYIVHVFLRIFVDLISTDTTTNGVFASKAYAALYPPEYIPFIVSDIVRYLVQNFCKMPKNTFRSFMCLLQTLYKRFIIFNYASYYKVGLVIIETEIQCLISYLAKFNKLYEFSLFSLLNIKCNTIANIEEVLMCLPQNPSYQSRLWLNNNIPYLLNHIEIKQFPNTLKASLDGNFSLSLKLESLHSIANRYRELMEQSLVNETLLIILDSFLKLPLTKDYFVICFTNIFFLLFEICDINVDEDLLNRLRCQYNVVIKSNIYFVSVYVSLLSCINTYSDTDILFFKNATAVYKNVTVIEDPDLNIHVSTTLRYLYKCVPVSDRHQVLKLAFMLLLNEETCFEIRKFVAQTFSVQLSSTFEMLQILTSYKHLLAQLGDTFKALSFLFDLTVLVSSLRDFFEKKDKFYYHQNSDICSYKYVVKQILLENIKTAFMICPRNICLKLLCDIDFCIH